MKLWVHNVRNACWITYKPLLMFEYFWSVDYFCVDRLAKKYCTKHLCYHEIMVCTKSEIPAG